MGGICDVEAAKAVARMIMEQYGESGELNEVGQMMVDAYKAMNKGFNPS
jgi:hypothetical protein